MTDLLPCPFCGPGQSMVDVYFDDLSHRYKVGCGRCGSSTGTHPRDKTRAPAIEAWNRRSPTISPATLKSKTKVEKVSGYKWPGVIVASFETTDGKLRYVVECTVPEVAGALHIYSPEQIRCIGDLEP